MESWPTTSRTPSQRKQTSSTAVISASELRLIRIFSTMLLFFLVGYVPQLCFMVVRLFYVGNIVGFGDAISIVHAVGFTGQVLASTLNPALILLQLEHFKFPCRKKKVTVTVRIISSGIRY